MLNHVYKPKGVCSSRISFKLDADNRITELVFDGGCSGNLQGISALALGQDARAVIGRLEGIKCGFKDTSCPDQLAKALVEALRETLDAEN